VTVQAVYLIGGGQRCKRHGPGHGPVPSMTGGGGGSHSFGLGSGDGVVHHQDPFFGRRLMSWRFTWVDRHRCFSRG
jgi:hypothetical protein